MERLAQLWKAYLAKCEAARLFTNPQSRWHAERNCRWAYQQYENAVDAFIERNSRFARWLER